MTCMRIVIGKECVHYDNRAANFLEMVGVRNQDLYFLKI